MNISYLLKVHADWSDPGVVSLPGIGKGPFGGGSFGPIRNAKIGVAQETSGSQAWCSTPVNDGNRVIRNCCS
jgi:hypothetical protein